MKTKAMIIVLAFMVVILVIQHAGNQKLRYHNRLLRDRLHDIALSITATNASIEIITRTAYINYVLEAHGIFGQGRAPFYLNCWYSGPREETLYDTNEILERRFMTKRSIFESNTVITLEGKNYTINNGRLVLGFQ